MRKLSQLVAASSTPIYDDQAMLQQADQASPMGQPPAVSGTSTGTNSHQTREQQQQSHLCSVPVQPALTPAHRSDSVSVTNSLPHSEGESVVDVTMDSEAELEMDEPAACEPGPDSACNAFGMCGTTKPLPEDSRLSSQRQSRHKATPAPSPEAWSSEPTSSAGCGSTCFQSLQQQQQLQTTSQTVAPSKVAPNAADRCAVQECDDESDPEPDAEQKPKLTWRLKWGLMMLSQAMTAFLQSGHPSMKAMHPDHTCIKTEEPDLVPPAQVGALHIAQHPLVCFSNTAVCKTHFIQLTHSKCLHLGHVSACNCVCG